MTLIAYRVSACVSVRCAAIADDVNSAELIPIDIIGRFIEV